MQLTGKTHLYAILADPVAHVRAPEFFQPVLDRHQLDAAVIPLHVLPEDLADVVPRLQRIGNLGGLIVTIPHKEAMARLCDELGANGRLVGAVNTVRFDPDGRRVGDMFDGIGLVHGARAHGIRFAGKRVLLVGAGGAGRAIAFALAQEDEATLTVANRTANRARTLVADVTAAFPEVAAAIGAPDPSGHDVIINATSLGLHETDPLPVRSDRLTAAMQVIEIIAPIEFTPFRQAAADAGCRHMGGRPMVEHQIEAQLRFLGEIS